MQVMETIALLGLVLTVEQLRACKYLDRAGKRFCVDFGYDNAIELAREHWRQKRREYREKRKRR